LVFQAPAEHPLRLARRARGLTLRGLADLAKVHLTRLHYLEHGLQPRHDELLRLAGVLRCSPSDLTTYRDEVNA
jgi:transcriptional regulator with XRE-family HTH domain